MTVEIVFYQDAQNPDHSEQYATIEEARIKAEELAASNQGSTIWVNEEPVEFWIYNYFTGKMEIDIVTEVESVEPLPIVEYDQFSIPE